MDLGLLVALSGIWSLIGMEVVNSLTDEPRYLQVEHEPRRGAAYYQLPNIFSNVLK